MQFSQSTTLHFTHCSIYLRLLPIASFSVSACCWRRAKGFSLCGPFTCSLFSDYHCCLREEMRQDQIQFQYSRIMLYPSVIFMNGNNSAMHTARSMQGKPAQTAVSSWERRENQIKHLVPFLEEEGIKGREESRNTGFERY